MKSPSPTIRDVARAAGVSPAAVSLALRGEGTLAEATRQRIIALASQMNYRRNVFAASLRTRSLSGSGQGMPLAVMVHELPAGTVYPIRTAREGLKAGCQRLGFALEEHHLPSSGPLRPLLRTLYHRGVQGLIIPHTLEIESVPKEEWARFCVVSCNRGSVSPVFHTVRASAFDVVVRAVREMVARGYRRIGGAIFRHSPPIMDDIAREAALLWSQQHHDLEPLPPHLGHHQDRAAFLAWARRTRPDAILAFHVGCLFWLREAGWTVPGRVSFCSLHIEELPATRGIAGFFTPDVDIGHAAILLMDSLIRHHERGIPHEVRETLLQRPWREGATLPPRRPPRPARVSKRQAK